MTELEKLMYRILGTISSADTPIVFKGALIKNLVLAEHDYNEIYRETTDIDCNWIGKPPSMNILVDTLNQSLGNLQNKYYAVAKREYGEKKSAGVNIIEKNTISVLSSNYIFRRTKDMIDVYSLANCVEIQTKEIFDIYVKTKRELQAFDAFLNRVPELEHAYNKLTGVEGKPDFKIIYSYLNIFLNPFIQKDYNNKIWENKKELWRNLL